MSGSLNNRQVSSYWDNGFLFPLRVMDESTALGYRHRIEDLESHYGSDHSLPHALNQYFRVNAHYVFPVASEIAFRREILDCVESILGPNLLIWSCELFIKEAGSRSIVSWHQDLTYWGLGSVDQLVTAWIALSPSTCDSGCMRFVSGSHKKEILPHRDSYDPNNLLSRGQEIAVEVDESEACDVVLEPGEMSLHHGRMFHASNENGSPDRRIGFVIRYLTPDVQQIVGTRDYAILARGVDRDNHWVHVAPPSCVFSPYYLKLYDEVRLAQSQALAQGSTQKVGLYD